MVEQSTNHQQNLTKSGVIDKVQADISGNIKTFLHDRYSWNVGMLPYKLQQGMDGQRFRSSGTYTRRILGHTTE